MVKLGQLAAHGQISLESGNEQAGIFSLVDGLQDRHDLGLSHHRLQLLVLPHPLHDLRQVRLVPGQAGHPNAQTLTCYLSSTFADQLHETVPQHGEVVLVFLLELVGSQAALQHVPVLPKHLVCACFEHVSGGARVRLSAAGRRGRGEETHAVCQSGFSATHFSASARPCLSAPASQEEEEEKAEEQERDGME
eukprot:764084-Hanusia_phi.AAC.5